MPQLDINAAITSASSDSATRMLTQATICHPADMFSMTPDCDHFTLAATITILQLMSPPLACSPIAALYHSPDYLPLPSTVPVV